MDKTVVLLRLAGTRCSMTWAKHTFKRKDREGHEQLYIKVPTDRDLIYLPVGDHGDLLQLGLHAHASHQCCQEQLYTIEVFLA